MHLEQKRSNQLCDTRGPGKSKAQSDSRESKPSRKTSPTTCCGLAPNAMRIPISGVLLETACASTVYKPTAESRRASPAKTAVSDATMRWAPRLVARLASSVVKREIG